MQLPIELFLGFVGATVALAIFGFLRNPQVPACLAFAGIFLLFVTVTTDSLVVGHTNPNVTNSTLTHVSTGNVTYTYQQIYTPTTNINATSSATIGYMTVTTGTSTVPLFAGSGNIASSEKVADSSSALIGVPLNQAVLSLKKVGAPTGNANIGTFKSTDSTVITTCANLDVTTLTTSQADYTFNCPSVIFLNFDSGLEDRFGIKYNAGDVSNNVVMHVDNGNPFDSTHSVRSAIGGGAWSDTTTSDLHMSLNFATAPKYIRDSDGRTYWQNNVAQEAPLCIQFDLGSTNIVNGFRMTTPDLAKIPSALKFYSSNDGSTYTFRQTFNTIQSTARQTYITNDTFFVRYYQLCVDQWGTANFWKISELDWVFASSSNANSSDKTTYTYNTSQPIVYDFRNNVGGGANIFMVTMALFSTMFILIGALMTVKSD